MNVGSHPRARAGFTLVELMIASLIFSMVIAGLAAIYSTAFSQSTRVLTETRAQGMGIISLRSLETEVSFASKIDEPIKNAAGPVLRGCWNVATDGQDVTVYVNGPKPPLHTFAFCAQPAATNGCTGNNAPECLFYYRWDAACVNPGLTTANCGSVVMGVTPTMIASNVTHLPGNVPYFSRVPSDSTMDNGIRAAFIANQPATPAHPLVSYQIDVLLESQFNGLP